MKNNPLGAILVTALLLCSLLAAALATSYLMITRELERYNGQFFRLRSTQTLVQALANEAILYGRTNAALDPILQQYSLKQKPAQPPAAQPPGAAPRTTR